MNEEENIQRPRTMDNSHELIKYLEDDYHLE